MDSVKPSDEKEQQDPENMNDMANPITGGGQTDEVITDSSGGSTAIVPDDGM